MTTGYNDRTCTNGKGGIKSVILFPLGNVSASTITANEVTSLTVTGEVFQYKLKSNLSSYTAPIQVNKDNGTLWYNQTLTMILASDTKELRSEIHLLAQNEVVCIVEKASGEYVALGFGEGLIGAGPGPLIWGFPGPLSGASWLEFWLFMMHLVSFLINRLSRTGPNLFKVRGFTVE